MSSMRSIDFGGQRDIKSAKAVSSSLSLQADERGLRWKGNAAYPD